MEPLDDRELSQLLQRWKAPAAPAEFGKRLISKPPSLWRWLITGSIRIPVPVGLAAILVLVAWIWGSRTPTAPIAQPADSITLADFQPVRQLEPTIVRTSDGGTNENDGKQNK